MTFDGTTFQGLTFGESNSGPTPNDTYDVTLPVVAQLYTPHDVALQIQAIVEPAGYDVVLPVRAQVYSAYDVALQIEAQVYGAVSKVWRPIVTIGGVDVSAILVGDIRIRFGEGISTTAYFSVLPADGVVNLHGWLKAKVTIDYKDGAWRDRKFTGEVVTPTYTPDTGLVQFECSSDLQGKMEQATREQIDATTPGGLHATPPFDNTGDGWQYAQNRMKTLPGSLWTDRNSTVRYTPWAAKTAPDLVLQARSIMPGSLKIKTASARTMINRVRIGMDYRYYNLREREHHFHMYMPRTWCDFITNNYKLPEKAQVRSAAESTGWRLKSIGYTDPPRSRFFPCGGQQHGWVLSQYAKTLCTGAVFTLSKRWAQEVTEDFLLDVRADESIAAIGEMGVTEEYNLNTDYDYSEWEQEDDYKGPITGMSLHPGGSGDTSVEAEPERRAELELAQQVILAKAATEILGTHRDTEVTFRIEMIPALDLSWTIEIQHPKIDVRAKVSQIEESLDVASGSATSTITLAVSRREGAGGGSASPLEPPERPEATQETPYVRTIGLGFRIGPGPIPGGSLAVPNLGEDEFNGFSTNDKNLLNDPNLVAYPEGMSVIVPVIEEAAVDTVVLQSPQTYRVVIPQDLFVLRK